MTPCRKTFILRLSYTKKRGANPVARSTHEGLRIAL